MFYWIQNIYYQVLVYRKADLSETQFIFVVYIEREYIKYQDKKANKMMFLKGIILISS